MKKPLAAICAAILAASLLPTAALAYRIPDAPLPCRGGATLVSSSTNEGDVTSYTIDKAGRVTSAATTNAEGFHYTNTYTYDASGRLITHVFTNDYGTRDTTAYTYDHSGRLAQSVISTGDTTVTHTFSSYTSRSYPQSEMGGGQTTGYAYDNQGNVTKRVTGLFREQTSYDSYGNATESVSYYDDDITGIVLTDYTYDKLGNVLTRTMHYSDGTPDFITTYTYSYPALKVKLSTQNLTVDGKAVDCEKYNIDGANYFKLRDIAQILRFTDSQFSVGFVSETNTVTINLGDLYEPNGTELITGTDKSATCKLSSQNITVNGKPVNGIEVYNIGGNNYFKLRDVASVIGFSVDYNESTRTATIDTDN